MQAAPALFFQTAVAFAAVFWFSAAQAGAARTVKGVTLEPSLQAPQGESLALRGAGIRSRSGLVDLYVGSLYTARSCATATDIIEGGQAAALRFDMISQLITSSRLASSTKKGLDKVTRGRSARLQPRLGRLLATLRKQSVGPGCTLTLVGEPGKGVIFLKNGEQVAEVKGDDFRHALFSIWLGPRPIDNKLKKALLPGHRACRHGA